VARHKSNKLPLPGGRADSALVVMVRQVQNGRKRMHDLIKLEAVDVSLICIQSFDKRRNGKVFDTAWLAKRASNLKERSITSWIAICGARAPLASTSARDLPA
jgi:hypothetical protein